MRKMAYITLAVGLVALAITSCGKGFRSQDEGPIIVQNGSMKIETTEGGKWEPDGGAWKNTTGKDHKGDLWVRIDVDQLPSCTGSGHPVHVKFTGGFQAHFNVAGGSSPYTNVEPKGQLDFKSDTLIEHPSNGPHDHIEEVKIGSTTISCGITETNLKAVNICSSAAKCK